MKMNEENNLSVNSEGFTDNQPLIDDVHVSRNSNKVFKWPKLGLTIEPAVFGYFLADGLSGPVIVNMIISRTCKVHFQFNETICSHINDKGKNATDIEALVQPYTSEVLTGMNFLSMFLPSILSLFLGSWSDLNGRKLLLVLPLIVKFLFWLLCRVSFLVWKEEIKPLMMFINLKINETSGAGFWLKYVLLVTFTFIPSLDPIFLLIAILPQALSGGFISFLSAAFSYICDISSEENRSFRISILEGFIYFGGIISALCTSPLYNYDVKNGCLLIFSVSGAVILLSLLYIYFFTTESVQMTEDREGFKHIFKSQFLKDMISVCFKKRENCTRTIILLIIISLTTSVCAMEGESNVKYLFLRLRFGWSIQEYSVWGCITLAICFVGLIITSLVLVKWLKMSDSVLGMIAFAMSVAGTLYVAFIPPTAPNLMYYMGFITLFGGAYGISGRSILSKSVPKEDLGKLFALTGACETIFPLVAVPLYTYLYDSTLEVFPSAFLLLSASLLALNFVFYLIIYLIQKSFRED